MGEECGKQQTTYRASRVQQVIATVGNRKGCGSEVLETEKDVDLKCYQPFTDKSSYFMYSQTSYQCIIYF